MMTTRRVDDDLLGELRARAAEEESSLTRMINRVLRLGLEAIRMERPRKWHAASEFTGHMRLVDLNGLLYA